MKLFWIYGRHAEDYWITTAEDVEALLTKCALEFNVTVEWAREYCTWSEINVIDGYKIELKKIG